MAMPSDRLVNTASDMSGDRNGVGSKSALSVKDRFLLGTIIVVFLWVPIAALAGGLAMAPLLAICGGVGILTSSPNKIRKIPYWILALALFLIWAFLSQYWSSFKTDDILSNPVKIILGAILYVAGFKAIIKAIDLRPIIMAYIVTGVTVFLAFILLSDLLTNFSLTFFFDPLKEGEDVFRKRGDARMNTGNAIAILSLLTVPSAALLLTGTKFYKLLAALLVALTIFAAFIGKLASVSIAVILCLPVFILTFYRSELGLKFVTAISMALVLFAPIWAYALRLLSDTQISKLPFSWEHRVEMWKYTSSKIFEAPLFGHGFDASRQFSDTFDTRGFSDLSLISLHPHNAGLHIWLETGLIGALLAVIFIGFIGRRAIFMSQSSKLMAASCASFMFMATLIASVSYGVWQDWWWAVLFCVAACLYLVKTHSSDKVLT